MAKILIVEDEENQRFLYKQVLGTIHEVTIVDSAQEAWLHVLPNLDLLITDKDLGKGLNGVELCELAHEVFPKIPMILVTGDTTVVHPSYIFVLFKPFTFAKLLHYIENMATLR